MNQDEMFDHMRAQQRSGTQPMRALYNTLVLNGCDTLPFLQGDEHLYIRCDGLPPASIRTIDFLASCCFLDWKMVGIKNFLPGLERTPQNIVATPYIDIFKKP